MGERGGRSVLINVKHVFLSSLCNSLIYMYIIHTLYACIISYNSPYSTYSVHIWSPTDQRHNLIFTHLPSLRMGILATDIPLYFCIPSLSRAQCCEWDKASTLDLSNCTAPPPKDPFPIHRQKVHELAVTKGADHFEKENKVQACIIISVKGKI